MFIAFKLTPSSHQHSSSLSYDAICGLFYVLQQDIKNRYRKQLEIDCDDIFEYKRDEEFMNNVKRNSMRYVQFFEKAATEILEGMVVDAADINLSKMSSTSFMNSVKQL